MCPDSNHIPDLVPHKVTVDSLIMNSRERIEAFDILIKSSLHFTAMECAHIGLELALKAFLKFNGVNYRFSHSLGYLAMLYCKVYNSPDYPKSEMLTSIKEDLTESFLRPDERERFWSAHLRYARVAITNHDIEVARKSCHIAARIISMLEQEQKRPYD